MATRVFLFQKENLSISLDGESLPGGDLRFAALVLPNGERFTIQDGLIVSSSLVERIGSTDDFRFKPIGPARLTAVLTAEGESTAFFGRQIKLDAAFKAGIVLILPGTERRSAEPFATIEVCAAFALESVSGAGFTTEPFCLRVTIDRAPDASPSSSLPEFSLKLPEFGFRLPYLRLPWTFPEFPGFPFHLPAIKLPHATLPLTIGWKGIRPSIEADRVIVDIDHLKIEGKVGAIEADAHLVLKNHRVSLTESYLRFYRPDAGNRVQAPISQWHFDAECLVLRFEDANLNAWLKLLAPDLADKQKLDGAVLTIRVLWNQNGLEELRLDWQIPGQGRTLDLPGFELTIPPVELYSFVVYRQADGEYHVSFIVTLDADSEIKAESTFTLTRDRDRELHNDKDRTDSPLIEFKASPSKDLSVVLMDLPLTGDEPIQFFKQLQTAVQPFDFADEAKLCLDLNYDPAGLRVADWDRPALDIDTDQVKQFLLPILRSEKPESSQLLTVKGARLVLPGEDPNNPGFFKPAIGCELEVEVKVGTIEISTTAGLEFDWERFAFSVRDDVGIVFKRQEPIERDFLGLKWTFAPNDETKEMFTLATRDGNFQLKQAPGAKLTIAFTRATSPEHPILFQVSDFALSASGISLTARVTDSPARLNGLETQARFLDGTLTITDNEISDFTITGQCPLPPALVGDATAKISLQFGRRDGKLELLSGIGQLQGSKLLKCQGTRFQFSVDGLGLKFVNDGRYHLYFTVTGQAKFMPLPGDDQSGPLAWLSGIGLQLIDAPLTGDAREISKHVKLLVDLPKKVTFNFLGCFKMELRGIAFHPRTDKFGDETAAMELSGQIQFAEGGGDVIDAKVDFHSLWLGLPAPGEFVPRIYLKHLGVKIRSGDAFELEGEVDFFGTNDEIEPGIQARGFAGSGTLRIQGLPEFAANFAFLRVSNDGGTRWVKSWFVYLEARKLSLRIPVVNIFLREVGLGFGYRYTLASIKSADELDDPKKLIKELEKLSRTQGELSRREQWRVDIEPEGEDPRWTIALRALISQTSAAAGPIDWNAAREKNLACAFLMDAVLALRSDLTFLMTVRGWMNTNYHDFISDEELRKQPLLSGFVLMSPAKKRFLAHLASNEGGKFGDHPPIPSVLKDAIANSRFTATLLIEPNLFHLELGWPNQLRWKGNLGPLKVEFRGGAIFRVSDREIVVGQSFLARGTLELSAEIDLAIVGARLSATANVAYGGRYIGVIGFVDPAAQSALYGAIGIEINVNFRVEFWIRIELIFFRITLRFRFEFSVSLTAFLEVGITAGDLIGLRGTATVGLRIMGFSLHFNVRIGLNEAAVESAFRLTNQFLNIGLEAEEVEAVPGASAARQISNGARTPARREVAPIQPGGAAGLPAAAVARAPMRIPSDDDRFETPEYAIFSIPTGDDSFLFVLLPAGERQNGGQETHFLPVPPQDGTTPTADFEWTLPTNNGGATIRQFDFESRTFGNPIAGATHSWRVRWNEAIGEGLTKNLTGDNDFKVKLFAFLRHAYLTAPGPDPQPDGAAERLAHVIPVKDPDPMPGTQPSVEDPRVYNPSESAVESAVRGAQEQFEGSPYLKRDIHSLYEASLKRAFDNRTTVYAPGGEMAPANQEAAIQQQQAFQLRGVIVRQIVTDLQQFAALSALPNPTPEQTKQRDMLTANSPAFQMGLVFQASDGAPAWLQSGGKAGSIKQRVRRNSNKPDSAGAGVRPFNTDLARFDRRPPQFQRVRHYTDANTIAISWDLVWPAEWTKDLQGAQKEPEHHLQHYLVRRRALAGDERELQYTLKNVEVLNRQGAGEDETLERLRPRFQLVEHFNEETTEDLAALPPDGKSYLYTITPIDVAGIAGARPLTVVATRMPSEPPAVPLDGEIIVKYRLRDRIFETAAPVAADLPVEKPQRIIVHWTPPSDPKRGPIVPVAKYRLVFRRETTFPAGSYGLDSDSQGNRTDGLPTSNARPLRTDIVLGLNFKNHDTDKTKLQAEIAIKELQEAGIFPADGQPWRPESWRIFFQTVSDRGVPSALVPVQMEMQFRARDVEDDDFIETRRFGQLEWPAAPVRFGVLPPEDERATTGEALVVMPVLGDSQDMRFDLEPADSGNLDPVFDYQPHPNRLRAIRFEFNQEPSGNSGYPADLHAGYRLYEFDLDAHTAEALDTPSDDLFDRMRRVQELRILRAENLRLTPGDTNVAYQWEAWYPSAVRRRHLLQTTPPPERSEASLSPWYSWRDSYLVWPDPQGFNGPPQPGAAPAKRHLHPFLDKLIGELEKISGIVVDLNPPPPDQPGDLNALLQATAPNLDPYGWNILKRMGLACSFTLRDGKTGEPIESRAALARLRTAVNSLPSGDLNLMSRHLHIEHLFQPSQSMRLPGESREIPAEALLAVIQISLRPSIMNAFGYMKFEIDASMANENRQVTVKIDSGPLPCRLVEQTEHSIGAPQTVSGEAERTMLLPPSGKTILIFQAVLPHAIRVEVINQAPKPNTRLVGARLAPTDWLAGYFDAPGDGWPEMLRTNAQIMAGTTELKFMAAGAAINWQRFESYLLGVNPPGTGASNDPRIELPKKAPLPSSTTEVLPAETRGTLMAWLNRFFEAGGDVGIDPGSGRSMTSPGPWIASAYQRAVSPVGVTPNAAGQIKYYHPVEDPWGHVYRYYILPGGRYDLLWQNLSQSARLYPDQPGEAENRRVRNLRALRRPLPPAPGGLDVVLDRIKSIAPPLVLYSGRLDPATTPAEATLPGRTWEVIVAKHPEQSLIERNRTLQRQLAYRQIAHSLLRRFAFPEELDQFRVLLGKQQFSFVLKAVENLTRAALPGEYTSPDHIDLSAPEGYEVRSLDLPERLRTFDQGAMVLQWESLPYFYEHRLLLVAQSSTTVSPVIDVIQRDFEYRSPDPRAELEGVAIANGERRLLAHIRLNCYWECLPDSVQARWAIEQPLASDGAARKYSSLPDTAVAYQIVFERDGGVIEAQAECTFSPAQPSGYAVRQIAKKFTVTTNRIVPPLPPAADATGQNHFRLETILETSSAFTLQQPQPRTLSIADDFTLGDRNRELLAITDAPFKPAANAAPEIIHRHLQRWAVACTTSYCWIDRKRERAALTALTASLDGLSQINEREKALMPTGLLSEARELTAQQTDRTNQLTSESPATPGLLVQARKLLEQERDRLNQLLANPQLSQPERNALATRKTAVEDLLQALGSALSDLASRIGLLAQMSERLDRLEGLLQAVDNLNLRISNLLVSAQTHVQQALTILQQEPEILRQIQERPDLLTRSPELADEVRERLRAIRENLLAAQDETAQLKIGLIEKLTLMDQVKQIAGELMTMASESREAAVEARKALLEFLNLSQVVPAATSLVEQSRDLLTADIEAPQKVPALVDRTRELLTAALESRPLLANAESRLPRPLELTRLKLAFVELLRANRELWTQLLKKLDFFNPTGQIWLICHESLTPAEREELRKAFPGQSDRNELKGLFLDLDDRQSLDQFLGGWRSEQAIGSRHDFPASQIWDDRIEFAAPETCVLALDGVLSPAEEDELRRLAESTDVSFATAARRLIDRMASDRTTIAEAGIGLEQIVELASAPDRAVAPTAQDRRLTWRGAIGNEQRRTLRRWAEVSIHGATFQSLLDAIDRKVIVFGDDSAGLPRSPEVEALIDDLDGRLSVNAESLTVTWRGLLFNPEEEAILAELGARADISPAMRRAIQSLLDELLAPPGANAQSSVSVSAPDDWRPRPGTNDLSPGLRSKLLIGNGRLRFYGWMTGAEARSLRQGRTQPDRDAIQRLFDASMRIGMDGGYLSIQSRRGSADVRKNDMTGVDLGS